VLSRARLEAQSQPVVLVRGQEQNGVGVDEPVREGAPSAGPAMLLVAGGPEPERHYTAFGVARGNPNRYHRAVIVAQVPSCTTVAGLTVDLVDDLFHLCGATFMSMLYGRHITPYSVVCF
jgi:hypothetical protein